MVDGAQAARVIIYDRPDTLDLEQIDAPIREAVRRINASGWCFTAESCSGHPDAAYKWTWGFNKPYLRLTTRREDMGRCLDLLSAASCGFVDDEGLNHTFGLQVFRYEDRGDFAQVGVYLDAGTVWMRDAAMRVFEAFGDAACASTDTGHAP
jgi:hypothetical protein